MLTPHVVHIIKCYDCIFSLQAAVQPVLTVLPQICDLTTEEPRNGFLQLLFVFLDSCVSSEL